VSAEQAARAGTERLVAELMVQLDHARAQLRIRDRLGDGHAAGADAAGTAPPDVPNRAVPAGGAPAAAPASLASVLTSFIGWTGPPPASAAPAAASPAASPVASPAARVRVHAVPLSAFHSGVSPGARTPPGASHLAAPSSPHTPAQVRAPSLPHLRTAAMLETSPVFTGVAPAPHGLALPRRRARRRLSASWRRGAAGCRRFSRRLRAKASCGRARTRRTRPSRRKCRAGHSRRSGSRRAARRRPSKTRRRVAPGMTQARPRRARGGRPGARDWCRGASQCERAGRARGACGMRDEM